MRHEVVCRLTSCLSTDEITDRGTGNTNDDRDTGTQLQRGRPGAQASKRNYRLGHRDCSNTNHKPGHRDIDTGTQPQQGRRGHRDI